jgi:hypothetical protein
MQRLPCQAYDSLAPLGAGKRLRLAGDADVVGWVELAVGCANIAAAAVGRSNAVGAELLESGSGLWLFRHRFCRRPQREVSRIHTKHSLPGEDGENGYSGGELFHDASLRRSGATRYFTP